VRSISYGSKPEQLFKDADLVIYLGGLPRRPGMERKDLLKINGEIFIEQGKALDKVAKKTVKNLIVANPPIANTLILSDHAPSINKKNFTSLSRLDQNRAVAIIASKANVDNSDVKNVIVWGNHST
jgi:malate/lactate dehydrogenase